MEHGTKFNTKDAKCGFCKRPYNDKEFAIGKALEQPIYICAECIYNLNVRFRSIKMD